jgi:hypothetical protein
MSREVATLLLRARRSCLRDDAQAPAADETEASAGARSGPGAAPGFVDEQHSGAPQLLFVGMKIVPLEALSGPVRTVG